MIVSADNQIRPERVEFNPTVGGYYMREHGRPEWFPLLRPGTLELARELGFEVRWFAGADGRGGMKAAAACEGEG